MGQLEDVEVGFLQVDFLSVGNIYDFKRSFFYQSETDFSLFSSGLLEGEVFGTSTQWWYVTKYINIINYFLLSN